MQTFLDDNVNILSITERGLLLYSNCIKPFYSPNKRYIAFWLQDYDNINDIYYDTYHLYLKDTFDNNLILIDTGNGYNPIFNDNFAYSASFSPDSNKILFLTTSTNLINTDPLYSSNTNDKYRWYIKDLVNNNYQRIIEDNGIYGNLYDYYQAIWYDSNNVIAVSFSNNLCDVLTNLHTEVFMKNINTNILSHISKNGSILFTSNSYNIAKSENKVSFFNNTFGTCFIDLLANTFQRVQLLPGIIDYGIVSSNILSWNSIGNQFIFTIISGNTIPQDINNQKDDFIFDLDNNTIIPINENITYGNSSSFNSKFSPDDLYVSFLTASSNIEPLADNDIVNLYIKEISTGDITRISKSYNSNNNYKIISDILGYAWVDNLRLTYTTFDKIIEQDINSEIDWYLANISNNSIMRLNYIIEDNSIQLFNQINNDYVNINPNIFSIEDNKILFSSRLNNFDLSFITPNYNKYNIFSFIFKNTIKDYPLPIDDTIFNQPYNKVYISDASQSKIKNIYSLETYKLNDFIRIYDEYTPDLDSINSSIYVEGQNTNLYKNVISDIRWMSVKYPNLPINTNNFILGMGVLQASPTIIDDIREVRNNNPVTNPVIGIITKMAIRPQNDVVLISAGDDQQKVCDAIVYLSASIIGNTFGHTFLWEQISGDIITITQNSNTTAYYMTDGTTRDRIFRFWVDKGKYNEQFQDLIIYATPTSIVNQKNKNTFSEEETIDDNLKVRLFSPISSSFDYNVKFNSWGGYLNTYDIMWDLPTIFYLQNPSDYYNHYKDIFYSTYIEIFDSSNWVKYNETITPNTNRIKNVVTGDLVRFVSTYYHNGQLDTEKYYTTPTYITPTLLGYNVLSKFNNTFTDNTNTYSIVYTVTIYNMEDTLYNIKNTFNDTTSIYQLVYNLEVVQTSDNFSNINNTMQSSFTLTLFNGDIIGG